MRTSRFLALTTAVLGSSAGDIHAAPSESQRLRGMDLERPRVAGMGRVYADADELRSVYSTMFDRVADDDSMDTLVAQQMVINFRLDDPSADIWVDGRTRPVVTTFEPIGVDATLTATLSADSMHELLLGTLPLGKALLFRKLKVSGSKSRALKLEPLLHACQAVYPDIAAEQL